MIRIIIWIASLITALTGAAKGEDGIASRYDRSSGSKVACGGELKWIDDHGAKYGLHRPLPKADPAHMQQRGDWHRIALALRESRTGSAVGDKPPETTLGRSQSRSAASPLT